MSQEKANRTTRQKVLILNYMKDREDEHVRAEDMLRDLNASGELVSKATVYRFLKVLEEEGQIRRYTPGDKAPACYQYIGDHPECQQHYHLMCSRCGEIVHVDSAQIRKFAQEMLETKGFSIDVCKTVFYGLCKDCKSAENINPNTTLEDPNEPQNERKEDQ